MSIKYLFNILTRNPRVYFCAIILLSFPILWYEHGKWIIHKNELIIGERRKLGMPTYVDDDKTHISDNPSILINIQKAGNMLLEDDYTKLENSNTNDTWNIIAQLLEDKLINILPLIENSNILNSNTPKNIEFNKQNARLDLIATALAVSAKYNLENNKIDIALHRILNIIYLDKVLSSYYLIYPTIVQPKPQVVYIRKHGVIIDKILCRYVYKPYGESNSIIITGDELFRHLACECLNAIMIRLTCYGDQYVKDIVNNLIIELLDERVPYEYVNAEIYYKMNSGNYSVVKPGKYGVIKWYYLEKQNNYMEYLTNLQMKSFEIPFDNNNLPEFVISDYKPYLNVRNNLLLFLPNKNIQSIIDNYNREITFCRATAVNLACQLYRLDYGHLPDKLEILVPFYLNRIPIDASNNDRKQIIMDYIDQANRNKMPILKFNMYEDNSYGGQIELIEDRGTGT
jgi:hypothetical protein